jgi:hydroxymethylpyrimidine kinase/phosphomethylpyrimidine kinase
MQAFGVHGCSVITAVTAQNTVDVRAVEWISAELLQAQLDALLDDLPPAAVKIGMLAHAAACRTAAAFFRRFSRQDDAGPARPLLVCDPVLKSTSGRTLLEEEARELLVHELFPEMDLLTPNLPEAAVLTGRSLQEPEAAAERLLETGAKSILIKGGHAAGAECRDYWTDGRESLWLSSPRIPVPAAQGTGCVLSSAIAAAAARGQSLAEAMAAAKTFVNQCLKSPSGLGQGQMLMRIRRFEDRPEDRPVIDRTPTGSSEAG